MPEADEANETIATFTHDGKLYEIDHLGIGCPPQWGEFAVYCDGVQITDFAIEESMLKPEHRPAELPVTTEQLIRLAREAVADDAAEEN
jgi:hypothetical protein